MDTQTLPIFPLPLVLFPGTPQLLHVFEPRYRQMLDDCLAGDRRFGLSYVDPRSTDDGRPRVGDVGCQTLIKSVHGLPDGRSNIECLGEIRYALEEYVQTDRMYHVARVSHFDDEPEGDEDLSELTKHVRQIFSEVMAGTWTAHGGRDQIPDDSKSLSLWIGAALEIDPAERQELLTVRSTHQRLKLVSSHLERVRTELITEIGSGLRQRRNGDRHEASADPSES